MANTILTYMNVKRIISIIFVAVLLVAAFNATVAANEDFVVEGGILVSYTGHDSVITIPANVYFIGDNAFAGMGFIADVSFPDTITSIGRRAFKDCTGLTSIKIPVYTTSIGTDAFSGCLNLSSVTLNDYVKTIGAGAFQNCPIQEITIPYSVTSIGISAFEGTRLSMVTIPSTVVTIGDFAFGRGNNLLICGVPATRAESFSQTFGFSFEAVSEPSPLPLPPPLPELTLPPTKIRDDGEAAGYLGPGERPEDYAVAAVNYLLRNTGIDSRYFTGFKTFVTREECAYYLIHLYFTLYGMPIDLSSHANPFSDTSDMYVTKARELELTGGTDGENNLFSPNAPVTREQMTAYFMRMLRLCGIDYNKESTDNIFFADNSLISPWALEDVRRAYFLGIINGTGNNNVSPGDNITREQLFTMMGNLLTNLNKIKLMYTRGTPINTPQLMYSEVGKYPAGHIDEAYYSAPSVIDINGDGRLEIISTAYSVFCIDAQSGQISWQVPSGYDRGAPAGTKPAGRAFADVITEDINNDGSVEIVVGHSVNNDGNQAISPEYWRGVVAVYDSNGYFKPGWPQQLPRPVNSVTVCDLNGDGTSEVIVGISGETSQCVWVYDCNGNVLPGWPQLTPATDATANFDYSQNTGYQYGVFHNNIAVGDINNDGVPEIVVPSDLPFICAYDMYGNLIKANPIFGERSWGRVGTWEDYEFEKQVENEGWGMGVDWQTGLPIDLYTLPREKRNVATFTHNKALICDVDNSGTNEVVIIGTISDRALPWPELPLYQSPFIFNGDRTRFKTDKYDWTSIPIDTGSVLSTDWLEIELCDPAPVVSDIDLDGVAEILYPSAAGKVLCFGLDKQDSWEYWVCDDTTKEIASPLTTIDINGDGLEEIFFTTIAAKKSGKTGSLIILDCKGNEIQKITLPNSLDITTPNGSISRPVVMDIDNDGRLEIVINSYLSGVVVYKL